MNRTTTFPRRFYTGLRPFLADVAWLFRHRAQLRLAHTLIAPAFRERLMLAVTAVNCCRYCSFVHTRMALAAGMEIENLFRYTALAVGLKPSASQGEARLRGLYRIIYSKTMRIERRDRPDSESDPGRLPARRSAGAGICPPLGRDRRSARTGGA
jgi:AhpD family alkylhydroperoxidase